MGLWNKTGTRPKGLSKQDNRTTVVTDRGFERNVISGTRVKREILVPLNSLTSTFPKPGVTDIWNEPASARARLTLLSGTVATTNGNGNIVGTGTKFQTELTVGQKVKIGNTYATVATISSNTAMTVTPSSGATLSGLALNKMDISSVVTNISFAEPLTAAAASKITINDVVRSTTISAVAAAPVAGDNVLRYTWTPTYPGTYTISTQVIANNTATAINLRSQNADTETANTSISVAMAAAPGTFTLSDA